MNFIRKILIKMIDSNRCGTPDVQMEQGAIDELFANDDINTLAYDAKREILLKNKNYMIDKKQFEVDYSELRCIDCPWCGHDRPGHSCGNCYSEMSKEDCWEWQGCCTEKCLKYITNKLLKNMQDKINMVAKCKCENTNCAKCLSGNCKDSNCLTHKNEKKFAWLKKFRKK